MRAFYNLFLITFVACLLESCGSSYPAVRSYTPVFNSPVFSYMPKPSSFDSLKTTNYVSAGYASVWERITEEGEEDNASMGSISFNRGHIYRSINLAYGIDMFAGRYRNYVIPKEENRSFKTKSTGAIILKSSINMRELVAKRAEFRPVGIDLSYRKEIGSFVKFRESISSTKDYLAASGIDLYTLGIHSEILFCVGKADNGRVGYRLSLQRTFGDLKLRGETTRPEELNDRDPIRTSFGIAFFGQLKRYFAVLEGGGGANGRLVVGCSF